MYWACLILVIIGMGILHGALFVFGMFVVILNLLWLPLQEGEQMPVAKLIVVVPLVLLVTYFGGSLFTTFSYNLENGLVQSVETYQLGGLSENARAHYKSNVNLGGVLGFLISLPISIFQYLFEPMPWRISSVADIPVLLENILRGWLIWKAVIGLKNMTGAGRKPVLFVFLCYLVIELIWSLGTVNWGTAIRHHIPGIGLLLIAAFAASNSTTYEPIEAEIKANNSSNAYTPRYY